MLYAYAFRKPRSNSLCYPEPDLLKHVSWMSLRPLDSIKRRLAGEEIGLVGWNPFRFHENLANQVEYED